MKAVSREFVSLFANLEHLHQSLRQAILTVTITRGIMSSSQRDHSEKRNLKGASDQMTQNFHVFHFPDTLSHLKSGAVLPWNNC